MPISRFPRGLSSFGMPVLPGFNGPNRTGSVFFVSSTDPNAADTTAAGSFEYPFKSINYAVTQCVANNGDIIFAKEGHVETVGAADAVNLKVAGVSIICLGDGAMRAGFNFTATAGDILVSAASVSLINPRFVTGIDAVVAALKVQAADFHLYNAEFYDAPAMASLIQILTTSAADRMVINGYRYFVSTTGTQKTDGIKIVGGKGIKLYDIEIEGDFSVACIDNATTAGTNWYLESISVNNLNAGPQPGLVIQAGTTGIAYQVRSRVASGTSYVSNVGKINWYECYGSNADGGAPSSVGTLPTTSLEYKIGTITNTGGTASIGAILGDMANVSFATYLGSLANTGGTAALGAMLGDFSNVSLATWRGSLTNTGGTASVGAILGDVANISIATRLKQVLASQTKSLAAAAITGTATQFTIAGGPIKVVNLGLYVTTVLPAGANTLKFSFTPTGGAATDLCGATDTASAAQEQVFVVDGVKATALVKSTDVGIIAGGQALHMPLVLSPGVIQTVFSAGPPASGAVTVFIEYEPLASGVTVV